MIKNEITTLPSVILLGSSIYLEYSSNIARFTKTET